MQNMSPMAVGRHGLRVISSADKVARGLLGIARKRKADGAIEERFARINGEPGILTYDAGVAIAATVFEIRNGRIRSVLRVVNPEKLRSVPPLSPSARA